MEPITRFINRRVLDAWEEALGRLDLNQYESAALRTALEAMESLIHARDEVDRVRGQVNRADGSTRWYEPTTYQQKQLFRAVSIFFDAYYTSVSTWSGVIARFSRVFGRNFSDNKPFLDWFRDGFPEQPLAYTELERARLFRALLSHPQQFPVYSWATYAAQVDPLLRIVVWVQLAAVPGECLRAPSIIIQVLSGLVTGSLKRQMRSASQTASESWA